MEMMDITGKTIRDRIVELKRVAASELVPVHPEKLAASSSAPSRGASRPSSGNRIC